MHRPFIPPDDIQAKAHDVLRVLDGLSIADAKYVLDVAQGSLSREVARTLDQQVFRTPLFAAPRSG